MDQISLGTGRDRDGKGTTAQEAQGNNDSSQPKITMTGLLAQMGTIGDGLMD